MAVDLTPKNDPGLSRTLSNLGLSLYFRSQSSGDPSDVAEAILTLQKAVNSTPEDHAQLPYWLANLGLAFQARYQRTVEVSDLDEALGAFRKSVKLTPLDNAFLKERLTNLGTALCDRFYYLKDITDINEAISAHQRSLSLATIEYPQYPSILSNLAWSFRSRSEATRSLADVDQAISHLRDALALILAGDERLPGAMYRLAASYALRFEHSRETSDMDQGIASFKQALDLFPEGHAGRPTTQLALAKLLCNGAELTGRRKHWDEGMTNFKLMATCASSVPRQRLEASTLWARGMYSRHPHSPDTILAFDTVIGLASLVAGLDQTLQSRYSQLQKVGGRAVSALEAAAAAFELGKPDKAVEWLEQGRCLVWSQLTALRTPFDELRAHDVELARRIENVSRRLEQAGSSRGQLAIDMPLSEKITLESEAKTYLGLAKEWEDILATVRSIEGFESFLKPQPFTGLLDGLPPCGFIVIVNIHDTRCDAVALTRERHSPIHIPLQNLNSKMVEGYAREFGGQLKSQGLRMRSEENFDEDSDDGEEGEARGLARYAGRRAMKQRTAHTVLLGLWTGLVKPVLDVLQIKKRDVSQQDLPRIWWCPTGPLTFLPIHAAGVYTYGSAECLMDYAVSSYTPTVGALTSRVRSNARTHNDKVSGLFLTSQPNAPGASAIPGTTREVGAIYAAAARHGARVSRVDGDDLTVDACLEYMEEYSGIHLACHASQNTKDPLKSRFRFHKGVMELSRISERNLKNADLAFLSACQTSAGEEKLSDEVVHLAAGMLAAGYRRVVATMWAISDRHAPEVAKEFYEYLWMHSKGGLGNGLDGSLSAYALHHSIQKLRQRLDISEQSLLTWAAYVHFGY